MSSFNATIESLLKSEAKGVIFIINNIESNITIEKLNSLLSKMKLESIDKVLSMEYNSSQTK